MQKSGIILAIVFFTFGFLAWPLTSQAFPGGTGITVAESVSNPDNPGWTYNNTLSATVLLANNALFYCGGTTLQSGDYIGVFYQSGGNQVCGGYAVYPESIIAIHGAESGFSGFQSNEPIVWKIWKKSNNTVFSVSATYSTISPFTISGLFIADGFGYVTALNDGQSPGNLHPFSLPAGWSQFAFSYDPDQKNPSDFFSTASSLVLVKDGAGQVFMPSLQLNGIGTLAPCKGYQALCQNALSFSYSGPAIQTQNYPLSLTAGWNLVGYPGTAPASISVVFSSILNSIQMVKAANGKVWVPSLGINQIVTLQPTEACWVKMAGSASFVFPSL